MAKQRKRALWSVEQRLEFIDFRLYWEGHVNRSDLIEFFGVSMPQASADLTEYQEQAKGNAVYDKTLKTYVAGPRFKARFFDPSADRYLAQLRLMEAGILSEDEAWAVRLKACSIVPVLRRRLDAKTLRSILDAIRTGSSLEVTYQSMSRPEPKTRWIYPHALGFDSYRWHARAWCHTRNSFRDFVLSRIIEVGEAKPSEIDPKDDTGWQREVTLRLTPHPALKDGKRKGVEIEFGMTDGVLEVKTRLCLAYYVERQYGLDRDPSTVEPERQQIVLANPDELAAARKEVGGACEHSESE